MFVFGADFLKSRSLLTFFFYGMLLCILSTKSNVLFFVKVAFKV